MIIFSEEHPQVNVFERHYAEYKNNMNIIN